MIVETLTSSEDALPTAPRETCGQVSLVGSFIIAKADVSIDSMDNVIGR